MSLTHRRTCGSGLARVCVEAERLRAWLEAVS